MAKQHHTLTAIAARALAQLQEPVLPAHDRQWKFFGREKTRTDGWFASFANFVEQRGDGKVKMLGFAPRLLSDPGRYFQVERTFTVIEGQDEDGKDIKVRKTEDVVGIYAPAPDNRAFRLLGTSATVSGTTFDIPRPKGKDKSKAKPKSAPTSDVMAAATKPAPKATAPAQAPAPEATAPAEANAAAEATVPAKPKKAPAKRKAATKPGSEAAPKSVAATKKQGVFAKAGGALRRMTGRGRSGGSNG